MPLVRIDVLQGRSTEYRMAIGEGIHRAMVEAIGIPEDDHFQVVTEHAGDGIVYDPQYLGVKRSDGVVFVQITMSYGRKPQQKRELYKRIVRNLSTSPGVRPEDVFINIVEVAWENWSFGDGAAQYMDV